MFSLSDTNQADVVEAFDPFFDTEASFLYSDLSMSHPKLCNFYSQFSRWNCCLSPLMVYLFKND